MAGVFVRLLMPKDCIAATACGICISFRAAAIGVCPCSPLVTPKKRPAEEQYRLLCQERDRTDSDRFRTLIAARKQKLKPPPLKKRQGRGTRQSASCRYFPCGRNFFRSFRFRLSAGAAYASLAWDATNLGSARDLRSNLSPKPHKSLATRSASVILCQYGGAR